MGNNNEQKKVYQIEYTEEEKTLIRTIFELYVNYNFEEFEIFNILMGVSIYNVLGRKIELLYEKIQDYDETISAEILSKNIKEELKHNSSKLIVDLEKSKDLIMKIDSTVKSCFIDDVDRIISIINCLEELLEKYENKFQPEKVNSCYKSIKEKENAVYSRFKPKFGKITQGVEDKITWENYREKLGKRK